MHLLLVNGRRMFDSCLSTHSELEMASTAGESKSAAEKQRMRWSNFKDKIIFPSLTLKLLISIKQK